VRRALIVALSVLGSCRPAPHGEGLVERARFGVLYGGEIQERQQIPFELDRRKLTLVLRVDFSQPLPREVRVAWWIDMPGSAKGVRDMQGRRGAGRLVKVDEARIPAGRARFDQVLPLSPGDPLGTWKIRAEVDGKTVLERPFVVYDPALTGGGIPDAGSGQASGK
jgi:hypothetical protein